MSKTIQKRKDLDRRGSDTSDFDAVIKKHVWKLITIGSAFGAIAILMIVGGYNFMGRSTFCGSCHSMENSYFTWKASKHKQFACNECHLPAGTFAYTFLYKAYAGLRDVAGEATRSYPFAIKLTNNARAIANSNCSRCHFSTIETTPMARGNADCMKCHKFLVHGRPVPHGGLF
jgi:cytochrome c nitrite reductase small subunit